eukprot:3013197-Amphidinium_carterae.2
MDCPEDSRQAIISVCVSMVSTAVCGVVLYECSCTGKGPSKESGGMSLPDFPLRFLDRNSL